MFHCVIVAADFFGGFTFCLSFVVVVPFLGLQSSHLLYVLRNLARLVYSVCLCVMVVVSGHIHLLFHDNTGCVFTINVPQYL